MVRAVVIAMLLASPIASAEPAGPPVEVAAAEPPGVTAPVEAPHDLVVTAPAPVAEPAPIDRPRSYDAAYDRAYAYSTALALRPGDFDVSLRSVLRHGAMVSVAAGIGHDVELSAQGIKSSYLGEAVGTGVKLTAVRERRIAIAFDANVFGFFGNASGTDQRMYQASMMLTTCVNAECSVLFDAGAGVAVATQAYGDPQFVPMLHSSMIFGTSWARPMFELAYLNSWLGFAGMRFGYRHIGVDAGLGVVGDGVPGGSATTAVIGLNIRP